MGQRNSGDDWLASVNNGPQLAYALYQEFRRVNVDDAGVNRPRWAVDGSGNATGIVAPDSTTALALGNALEAPKNTIVIFGDSRCDQCGVITGTITAFNGSGWYPWFNFFAGGAFTLLSNAGVSGEDLTHLLARIDGVTSGGISGSGGPVGTTTLGVTPFAPGWCGIMAGINNIGEVNRAYNHAQMVLEATAILNRLEACGIKVFWFNEPAVGATTSGYNATYFGRICEWNAWLLDQQSQRPGLIVVDIFALSVNPTNATGNSDTKWTYDDIVHPSNLAAKAYGYAAWQAVSQHVRAATTGWLPSSVYEISSTSTLINQKQVNPLLTGSIAASGYASATGNMPTGCSYAGSGASVVGSVATHSSGFGQTWSNAITFTGASDYIELKLPESVANIAQGDELVAVFELSVTGPAGAALAAADNLDEINTQLRVKDGSATDLYWTWGNDATGTEYPYEGSFSGVVTTYPATVPSNGAPTVCKISVYARAAGAGGCVVNISRVAIRKTN